MVIGMWLISYELLVTGTVWFN